ncbi:MAG: histidine triad nucleotide-binding protein [Burkholderiales bacterium]|nr:histidine triad nucleotide-binding protein [Burkholderiales bacterium]
MESCIFCRIIRGEIPSRKIFEDDDIVAFHDIHPAAPVHFMLIPKAHVESLAHADDTHRDVLGKMMVLAPRLAKELGLNDGFRTIVNTGRVGGQEVLHLHMHVLGGKDRLPPMLARN